ncbi:MAG TPA: aspartate kinase [Methanotrichaceae archaeon]|nr:aspartate kinase [Methanotrichaceae archaeon]
MARLVMKFGGSSVADGAKLRNVGELVNGLSEENEIVVVTSALGGVTDDLLQCARNSANGGKVEEIVTFVDRLSKKHIQALMEAVKDPAIVKELKGTIIKRVSELEKAYIGICYLGELSPRSIDRISSYGERLAAPLLSGVLRDLGLKSRYYTGGEAGIITTSDYGNGKPLEKTDDLLAERLTPIEGVPVVTGFIAEDERGNITTLGRGGSDFSASIIGAAIGADEIWFWKDTTGVLTTDPRIVSEAKNIPVISYREAMEMSYFGAKVLHPRAIEPAIRKGIPVRVKCTFDPQDPGTLIVKEDVTKEGIIKAVTLSKNVALLTISGAGMIGTPGIAARAFSALANAGVNITMISQGSSEANISIVVDEPQLEAAEIALGAEFPTTIVREISHNRDVSVIAVIGSGMAGTPGVAGRVFGAMGKSRINVVMISQGSSEHNISFVVSMTEAERTIQELHREFGLEGEVKR